jgi:hypothetical protein
MQHVQDFTVVAPNIDMVAQIDPARFSDTRLDHRPRLGQSMSKGGI